MKIINVTISFKIRAKSLEEAWKMLTDDDDNIIIDINEQELLGIHLDELVKS